MSEKYRSSHERKKDMNTDAPRSTLHESLVPARIDALYRRVITNIEGLEAGSEKVTFTIGGPSPFYDEQTKLATGSFPSYLRQITMLHQQDCCENVYVEEVIGDPDDLLNSPILMAEEVTQEADLGKGNVGTGTWTFYKLATAKGYVTIRWLGTSNGYYSEAVDVYEHRTLVAPPASQSDE